MPRANIKKVARAEYKASTTAAEIRAAKSYLNRRGLSSRDISPRKFATTSKRLGIGFSQTLKMLARQLSGGQV